MNKVSSTILIGFLIFALQANAVVEDKNAPEALASPSYPVAGVSPPDGFGYVYADSNDAAGPRYQWFDISQTGTPLGLGDDDHAYIPNLPFSFNFYGTTYDRVWIGSNGTVYFANDPDDYLGLSNLPIPSLNGYKSQRFIALYWDDLDPSANGEIYYRIIEGMVPRALVIQWEQVPLFSSNDTITAQVILFEGTDQILLQYKDPSSAAGRGATVGIQGDPTTGLQYSFNTPSLTADLAICFAPPGPNQNTSCQWGYIGSATSSVPSLSLWGLLALTGLLSILAIRHKKG